MRRSTGAILRESRPATIIRSDCRGDARNTSAPNRAISYREQLIAIISMAQHAKPNVHGQIADRRAQLTTFSTVVVRTGISRSSSCCSRPMTLNHPARYGPRRGTPVENALAPDVHVPGGEDSREQDHLHVPGPSEIAERHSPGIQERHLDVEQEEDHRHEVELHR